MFEFSGLEYMAYMPWGLRYRVGSENWLNPKPFLWVGIHLTVPLPWHCARQWCKGLTGS